MHHPKLGNHFPQGGGNNHSSSKHHTGIDEIGAQRRLSAMGRSATEHDIKIRNRRSMAVGPFEDLPPHIRQHMVIYNTFLISFWQHLEIIVRLNFLVYD